MVSRRRDAIFFREKKSGGRKYLQIVENRWEDGRSKQRVIATLGRLDKLSESGAIDSLLRSASRFARALIRSIFHKCDETIIGHVFCWFFPLVLMKELNDRIERKGYRLEWADVIRDLDRLEEVKVEQEGKRFMLRSGAAGVCGKVFQAAGVAMPPTVRQLESEA